MPPEVLLEDKPSPATDAFSLGVLLWEMMSGVHAWRGCSAVQVLHAVALEHRTLTIPGGWPPGIKVGQPVAAAMHCQLHSSSSSGGCSRPVISGRE